MLGYCYCYCFLPNHWVEPLRRNNQAAELQSVGGLLESSTAEVPNHWVATHYQAVEELLQGQKYGYAGPCDPVHAEKNYWTDLWDDMKGPAATQFCWRCRLPQTHGLRRAWIQSTSAVNDHVTVGAGTSEHACEYEKDHGEDRLCSNINGLLDIIKNRCLHDHNVPLYHRRWTQKERTTDSRTPRKT